MEAACTWVSPTAPSWCLSPSQELGHLRGPGPALWNTRGQRPDRLQPGCAPRPGFTSLCLPNAEVRPVRQLRVAVGTSMPARRHTHRPEKNSGSGLLAATPQPSSRWPAKSPKFGLGITNWPRMDTGVHQKNRQRSGLSVQRETKPEKKVDGWSAGLEE